MAISKTSVTEKPILVGHKGPSCVREEHFIHRDVFAQKNQFFEVVG